ncbi:MFS transporter [Herbiconiux sp. VKM Ac-1786]|uniref:MFS transporter n=1 Tax=Herbiconiux sp. VKM Ac-1786 TaxID=2783824 RepID=UPI00188B5929|nr:MFS transporter [Herbiconiux sp. VKM Ac-1786]MBF4572607.1 MFS transporter [Herbiconiux sp. VKM Ac-1786]
MTALLSEPRTASVPVPATAAAAADTAPRGPGRGRGQLRLPHAAGFWVTAVAFLVMMAFNTVPTPLYALYQQRDGFPTVVITIVFAAYSTGVMLALYLAGHLSDRLGRRRVILTAAAIELVAAVLFVVWPDAVGLVVARFVAGLGIGVLTATATAHLADLRRIARPGAGIGFAATIAGVANMGGLALGPLIGGVFAEWVGAPLVTPYLVFAAALVAVGFAYAFVPETVTPPTAPAAYRPQRVRVPAESRGAYWAAGLGGFAAFAITGLFGSVAPTFLAQLLHQTDHLVAGVVSFSVFGAAALAQIVFSRLSTRRQLVLGVVGMAGGLLALGAAALVAGAAGDAAAATVLFVGGGVAAGAGVGLVFRGALATAGSLATGGNRSEITSGIFLLAFAGMTVPPLAVGAALLALPLVPVLLGFVGLVLVLILWAGPRMIRTTR